MGASFKKIVGKVSAVAVLVLVAQVSTGCSRKPDGLSFRGTKPNGNFGENFQGESDTQQEQQEDSKQQKTQNDVSIQHDPKKQQDDVQKKDRIQKKDQNQQNLCNKLGIELQLKDATINLESGEEVTVEFDGTNWSAYPKGLLDHLEVIADCSAKFELLKKNGVSKGLDEFDSEKKIIQDWNNLLTRNLPETYTRLPALNRYLEKRCGQKVNATEQWWNQWSRLMWTRAKEAVKMLLKEGGGVDDAIQYIEDLKRDRELLVKFMIRTLVEAKRIDDAKKVAKEYPALEKYLVQQVAEKIFGTGVADFDDAVTKAGLHDDERFKEQTFKDKVVAAFNKLHLHKMVEEAIDQRQTKEEFLLEEEGNKILVTQVYPNPPEFEKVWGKLKAKHDKRHQYQKTAHAEGLCSDGMKTGCGGAIGCAVGTALGCGVGMIPGVGAPGIAAAVGVGTGFGLCAGSRCFGSC